MPRPILPKRCDVCTERCTKQPSGSWLCDPLTGGCGWSDDPSTIQPQGAAPQTVEAMPASEAPAES